MISEYLDITDDFNANNGKRLDLGGWETATFQFVSPGGTINIQGSNDGNAQTGVTDGNAFSAINFTNIQAINLSSGAATSSVSTSGLYKVTVPCKYIFVGGASASATKVIVFMNKPY